MAEDKKSWDIKEEAVCEELAGLVELSADETAALTALKGEAEAASAAMAQEFHGRLTANENTKEFFDKVDVSHVSDLVAKWFVELFGGVYDKAYAEKRLKIGKAHVRIGLPVRYPLAMLDIIMKHGEAVAEKGADAALAKGAFKKVLALDVAVFNQAYEDNQLKHLAELVGGERLARRLLTGEQ